MLNDRLWGPSAYTPPFHTPILFSPMNPLSSLLACHPTAHIRPAFRPSQMLQKGDPRLGTRKDPLPLGRSTLLAARS